MAQLNSKRFTSQLKGGVNNILYYTLLMMLVAQTAFGQVPTRFNEVIAKKLDVDNIRVDANSIISTNTNGDISITPNGTGKLNFDFLQMYDNVISTTSVQDLFLEPVGGDVRLENGTRLGVGAEAAASSLFEVSSTTKGSIPAPKMTTVQRDAVSAPTAGLQVYNTDTNALNVYSGTSWIPVGSGGAGETNFITNPGAEEGVADWWVFKEDLTYSSVNTTTDIVSFSETFTPRPGTRFIYTTSGTPIGGLTSGNTYYVSNTVTGSPTTFKISPSTDVTSYVDLTSAGTGTHTFVFQEPSLAESSTANVTFGRTSATPLLGDWSFEFAKDAADRRRQGVATDIEIDNTYRYKVLTVDIDFNISSGTFAAGSSNVSPGDMVLWIIDTSGNKKLIQPSSIYFNSTTTTGTSTLSATFQSSSSFDYRLVLYVQSSSASAYTIKLDNIRVSPSKYVYGTPITDWSATAAITIGATTTAPVKGTVGTDTVRWRRVGDSYEVEYTYYQTAAGAGTTGSGDYLFSLPSGLVFSSDIPNFTTLTNLHNSADATRSLLRSSGTANLNSSTADGPIAAYKYSSTQFRLNGTDYFATTGNFSSTFYPLNNAVIGWKLNISFKGEGISSSVQMSDNASQRVVAFSANTSSTAATTSAPFIYTVVENDTTGSYSTSTGRFTAPVAGTYQCNNNLSPSGGATVNAVVYKNGSAKLTMNRTTAASGIVTNSFSLPLVVNDTLEIRPSGSATADGSATNSFSCFLVGGNQTIGATETIAASCYVNSGVSTTSSNPINYDVCDINTHGAAVPGVGTWRFTSPQNRVYIVTGKATNASGSADYTIFKNGTSYKNFMSANAGTTAIGGGGLVSLNAGEYIEVRPSGTVTPAGISGTTQNSHINIVSVGGR